MKSFAFLCLLGITSAHYAVDYPWWRGESLDPEDPEAVSQWMYPCAGINETDLSNRTQWPTTGGSVKLEVHHPWALTYVNLGLGQNISAFNISLVNGFNQTGNGTFCLKETGKANLEAGLKKSNLTMEDIEGMPASLMIVQIASTGAGLYNCADIIFNSTAALLSDEECKNGTGVGGVAIQNVDAATPSPTESAAPTQSTGAAALSRPAVAGSWLAGAVGLGFAML